MTSRMEATSITFEIPGDPVPQPRARMTRAGHVFTPTKNGIGTFKKAISILARAHAERARWQADGSAYAIAIAAHFSIPRSYLKANGEFRASAPRFPLSCDVDNVVKGVWDAITKSGAVWRDDRQVVNVVASKRFAARGESPRTVVTIRKLKPA